MKPNRTLLVCWIVAIVSGLAVFGISSEDRRLFEKALLLEEAQGQLEEAIALYRQVVDQAADEALAAQAQLHIGLSYEKLGKEAAVEAYRIVIDRYPLQADAADQARTRLAALETPPPDRMIARRLWSDAKGFEGAVSPDGRYVSFADWETANLGVYEVASGQIRDTTTGGSWKKETYNYAETSAWSPDGKQLVYTRWHHGRYELRLTTLDSFESRLLYRSPEVWGPYEGGWSPDGKFVSLTLARDDGTFQIAVYSMEEQSVKVLKSVDWRWPSVGTFSPDGKFFAYSYAPEEQSPNRDIYLMAPDGSREIHLVDHPADDQFMGWMPDGSILFKSDRSKGYGLWRAQLADGKMEGDPVLLKTNLGDVAPLGTTRSGSLYYGVDGGGGWDAFTVTFDPRKAEIAGTPKRVDETRPGRNSAVAWSPDGKRMAFASRRGLTRVIVIRSMETGEEQEIGFSLDAIAMRWFPDGESVLFVGKRRDLKGAFRIRLNQPDAEPEFLFKYPFGAFDNPLPQISPDGQAIYALAPLEGEGRTAIQKFIVANGEFRTLFESKSGEIRRCFALSPDGTKLAVATGPVDGPNRLVVISTATGERRALEIENAGESLWIGRGLIWTPDGRHLLFTVRVQIDGEDGERLVRVSRDGGVIESASGERIQSGTGIRGGDPFPSRARQLYFHPDGKTLGFTGRGRAVVPHAVWVLENLTSVR